MANTRPLWLVRYGDEATSYGVKHLSQAPADIDGQPQAWTEKHLNIPRLEFPYIILTTLADFPEQGVSIVHRRWPA